MVDTHEQAQQWLTRLASNLGIPSLVLENGICTLDRSGKYTVSIELDAPAGLLHVWAPLFDVGQDVDSGVYASAYEGLLMENLTQFDTGGARFALDPVQGRLLLCASFHVGDGSGASFHKIFPHFVAAADRWFARLHGTPA